MKQLCFGSAVLGAALVVAPMLAYAQMPVDIGKREYFLPAPFAMATVGREMAHSSSSSKNLLPT